MNQLKKMINNESQIKENITATNSDVKEGAGNGFIRIPSRKPDQEIYEINLQNKINEDELIQLKLRKANRISMIISLLAIAISLTKILNK